MVLRGNGLMKNLILEERADKLLRLYEERNRGAFPYADCRRLLREDERRYKDLIPDLDMYFSNIAGYCSWGGRISKWSKEKIRDVQERISKPFFQKHPQYKPLEPLITEISTPDLYARLVLLEKLRAELLELLSQLTATSHLEETAEGRQR